MLRELRLRNFAVVESVVVPFAPGLNVLTGETGAGKSILVDAILLVTGARAQSDVIRADADTATVEAVLAITGPVAAVLEEAGLRADDNAEVVVRRELARSGRHRAFVNDSPVTVGLLERIGDLLVEVHGQHEHQRLLEPVRQLELLDRFAGDEDACARVAALHAKHRAAREEAERTRAAARDRAQREDLLRFQVTELDAARLRLGEEEELRTELRRLQHAERFTTGLSETLALLDDAPQSATERLAGRPAFCTTSRDSTRPSARPASRSRPRASRSRRR
jgi:DNA repair protein RecN (Recombination protein N)